MVSIEEQRKNEKIVYFTTATIVGIIAGYFLGYTLYYNEHLNLMDSLSSAYSSIMSFDLFYKINAKSVIAFLCCMTAAEFAAFYLLNEVDRDRHYKKGESAGTGGFMSTKDIKNWSEKFTESNSLENMIYGNTFVRSINDRKTRLNNNLLVIGGAGTGKSRFVIKPNVLQFNASYIITDPSGEILADTGKALSDNGYVLKVFNISDMQHSNCYNPLNYIRDEAGVQMLVECFISNTTDDGAGKGDQFFTNAEKLLYSACIFYLTEFETDKAVKNFSNIVNMVNASSVDENNAQAESEVDKLFASLDETSLAWKYYRAFKQAAGKTLKSIIISCVTRLQPFLTPGVANLTKTDELELHLMGDRKTALFIITPQADRTYSFLASMLYSQLFETLYYRCEQNKAAGGSERLKYPVRCLMDEFANIGTIPEFPSKLSTMRKYNISSTIVLQDKSQIEAMYKDEWKTLVANCDNILYLGSSEPDTLQYISDKLGKMTITTRSRGKSTGKGGGNQNYSETQREVMTAEEVGRMDNSKCIIFTRGQRPMFDDKYHYENHPNYNLTKDFSEDYSFNYVEISAFNNTRPSTMSELLRAFSDIEALEALEQASNPTLVGEENNEFNIEHLSVEEEKYAELFNDSLERAMDALIEVNSSLIPIAKVKGIPLDSIEQISTTAIEQIGTLPSILFVEHGDRLFGIGVDNDRGILKKYANTDHTIEFNVFDNIIAIVIKTNVFEQYKLEVIENAEDELQFYNKGGTVSDDGAPLDNPDQKKPNEDTGTEQEKPQEIQEEQIEV